MMARVGMLVPSFRVCVVVFALLVLLALVLPTPLAETTRLLLLVVLSVRS